MNFIQTNLEQKNISFINGFKHLSQLRSAVLGSSLLNHSSSIFPFCRKDTNYRILDLSNEVNYFPLGDLLPLDFNFSESSSSNFQNLTFLHSTKLHTEFVANLPIVSTRNEIKESSILKVDYFTEEIKKVCLENSKIKKIWINYFVWQNLKLEVLENMGIEFSFPISSDIYAVRGELQSSVESALPALKCNLIFSQIYKAPTSYWNKIIQKFSHELLALNIEFNNFGAVFEIKTNDKTKLSDKLRSEYIFISVPGKNHITLYLSPLLSLRDLDDIVEILKKNRNFLCIS
ncbi:MAG: hypothetical protein Fur0010_00500 [Bdellovibrio sp.]